MKKTGAFMRIKSTLLFIALAVMLVCGVTVSAGYAKSINELEQQANKGDVAAQYNLAEMYFDGDGVEQDDIKYAYWLGKAAEQGHAEAQVRLGYMYYSGDSIAQDYAKAVYWFEKAVEQGNGAAQLNLGTMYYNGQGVTQDKQKGCALLRAAVDQDSQDAKDLYYRDCQQ